MIAQLCYFIERPSLAHFEGIMVRKVTLRRMGGSVGATLPKDMADRLHVQAGDEVFVVETEQGVLLTPYDPDFQKAMKAYERTASKYRNALRELAK
jgi:putative addiction module antidote